MSAHLINHHSPAAISITSAGMSPAEEYQTRRRRYAIMMAIRAVFVVAAVLTYQLSMVLALGFVVGGIVLPWCAVLYANERLPQAPGPVLGGVPANRLKAIPAPPSDRVIDL